MLMMPINKMVMMTMAINEGCAPFTYDPFTYHPFYLQIVGKRVGFHHHHYHWSSIGRNGPNLISKINKVLSSLVLGQDSWQQIYQQQLHYKKNNVVLILILRIRFDQMSPRIAFRRLG